MNKENCCGCRACEQICPKKCIEIVEDQNGFSYAKINEKNCIHCNMCKKVCPMINSESVKNDNEKAYYLIHKNKNVIEHSSSGGAFTAIAEIVANKYNNNYAIYGATMNDTLKVKHTRITDINNIGLLQKSKYIQSDMNNIFKSIKKDLENKMTVLFVGTPCQVAAVKLYTQNIKKGKLILIDLVCHGVPSQKIFNQYIESLEKKENGIVINYEFRNKKKLLNIIDSSSVMYKLDKEKKIKEVKSFSFEDEFMKAFYGGLIYRPSCFSCPYATSKRVGDITIADFWGIEKKYHKLNPQKGISLLIINNDEFNDFFTELEKKTCIKEEDYNLAIKNNRSLKHPSKKNKNYDRFLDDINHKDFCSTVNKYIRKKRKIEFYVSRCLSEDFRNKIKNVLKGKE